MCVCVCDTARARVREIERAGVFAYQRVLGRAVSRSLQTGLPQSPDSDGLEEPARAANRLSGVATGRMRMRTGHCAVARNVSDRSDGGRHHWPPRLYEA
jgi:hypothetical protein